MRGGHLGRVVLETPTPMAVPVPDVVQLEESCGVLVESRSSASNGKSDSSHCEAVTVSNDAFRSALYPLSCFRAV